jgi:uncharacterized RDD family membrane protein YckC
MLDTLRTVETPEGADLTLSVAGPVPRALAWGLDALLRGLGYAALSIPLALLGNAGGGLMLIVLFLGEWFYPVLFEVHRGGATPGKRVLGLRVLHDDGTPVGWTASLLRNLLRAADFLPLAYGAGIASMMLNEDFKRLGDLAAGTVVVHQGEVEEPTPAVATPEAPAPPAVPLSLGERRALGEYARRLPSWSEGRAQELANLATPLTGERGRVAVHRLLAIAAWLAGRR